MHLILVEDLDTDREKLEALIREDCRVNEQDADFSFYKSGEDFLSRYHPGSCDALFLDILLDGMSGIDVAGKVREEEPRLPIVFITTEPDFALDGFSVHAMDFLVKPLKPEKLSWCLKELREYLSATSSITVSEVDSRGHSRTVTLALDSILYGLYWNHVMEIHTVSRTVHTRLSFQDFTALLPHSGRFYVCGRGLVVNLSHADRVMDGALLLKNGERLQIARTRQDEVRTALSSWIFFRTRKGGWA